MSGSLLSSLIASTAHDPRGGHVVRFIVGTCEGFLGKRGVGTCGDGVTPSVGRVDIDGGLQIRGDGTYSSEYSLPQIQARLADELVRMEYRRDVILAFRKAHNFPRSDD